MESGIESASGPILTCHSEARSAACPESSRREESHGRFFAPLRMTGRGIPWGDSDPVSSLGVNDLMVTAQDELRRRGE